MSGASTSGLMEMAAEAEALAGRLASLCEASLPSCGDAGVLSDLITEQESVRRTMEPLVEHLLRARGLHAHDPDAERSDPLEGALSRIAEHLARAQAANTLLQGRAEQARRALGEKLDTVKQRAGAIAAYGGMAGPPGRTPFRTG